MSRNIVLVSAWFPWPPFDGARIQSQRQLFDWSQEVDHIEAFLKLSKA